MDTGVLVSAFAFGGIPEKAVRKAFTEAEIFVSPTLLKEYRDVPLALKSDGKIDLQQFKALISGIAAFVAEARVVYPTKRFAICRDAADNMLLECCYTAGAKILITGDADLLDVEVVPFELKILTPRKYLEEA